MLYNLIPIQQNLFVWQLSTSDLCHACNVKGDLVHAFLHCKLNLIFFENLADMVKNVYKIDLCLDINILLKNYKEKELEDIITIALWSIYKLIVRRNMCGKEEREKRLWFTFMEEVKLRISINNASLKNGKEML